MSIKDESLNSQVQSDDGSSHLPLSKRSSSVKNLIKIFQPKLDQSEQIPQRRPKRNFSLAEPKRNNIRSDTSVENSQEETGRRLTFQLPKKEIKSASDKPQEVQSENVASLSDNNTQESQSTNILLETAHKRDNTSENNITDESDSTLEKIDNVTTEKKNCVISNQNQIIDDSKNRAYIVEDVENTNTERGNLDPLRQGLCLNIINASSMEQDLNNLLTPKSEGNETPLNSPIEIRRRSSSIPLEMIVDETVNVTVLGHKKVKKKHASMPKKRLSKSGSGKNRSEGDSPKPQNRSKETPLNKDQPSRKKKRSGSKLESTDEKTKKKAHKKSPDGKRKRKKRINGGRKVERVNTAPELRARKLVTPRKEDFDRIETASGSLSPRHIQSSIRCNIYHEQSDSTESTSSADDSLPQNNFYDSDKSFESHSDGDEYPIIKKKKEKNRTKEITIVINSTSEENVEKKKCKKPYIIIESGRNIWLEPEDTVVMEEPTSLSYHPNIEMARKGGQGLSIKYASLNKLIQHLTWPDYNEEDKIFAKVFLNTYEAFTSPEIILQKFRERINVPKPTIPDNDWEMTVQAPIQSRVCSVLKLWIDTFSSNLTQKFSKQLKLFIKEELSDQTQAPLVDMLYKRLDERKMKDRMTIENTKTSSDRFKLKRNQMNRSQSESSLFSFRNDKIIHQIELISPLDAAKQITFYDHKFLCSIKPWEVFRQVWDDETYGIDQSPLKCMVDRFNKLSSFVVSAILTQKNPKLRARVISRFVKIAKHLRRLNNFNSTMAILSGINHSCIQRLTATFSFISRKTQKTLHKLDRFMSVRNNFGRYREYIMENEGPCIPYLGLIIADYAFIEEGNPDLVGGLINFSKVKQLYYNCIELIQTAQNRAYEIAVSGNQIEKYLQAHIPLDQNDIYQKSISLEPVHSNQENIGI